MNRLKLSRMWLRWRWHKAHDWFLHQLWRLKLRKTSPYLTDRQKIMLPMIRRVLPDVIAHDIIGVQPMTGDVGTIFTMKIAADTEEAPKEGATRHAFGQGWQRYYGGEWIPDSLYWDLKIKGVKLS